MLLDGISNYVKGEISMLIHTCQVMEQLGPKQNTNNINPYVTKYDKTMTNITYSLLSKIVLDGITFSAVNS